jgi:hypothetical protein
MTFQPRCLATGIGSFPHPKAEDAVRVILQSIPDAPVWPQLPATDINEQMEVQYSEGLPRVVIDREKARMYIDTSGDYSLDLATFYENFLADNVDHFQITPAFSKGVYALEAALKSAGRHRPLIKLQTTGPLTFGLTIVDENKRAIYYHAEFIDAIVKVLVMKCRWQIRRFRPLAENVLCFVDEPILSAFGSSTYMGVSREDVVAKLREVIEAIQAEGALAGVHCCGNTEWPILIDAGADIISFDAFDFAHTVALYPEPMRRHLEGGKVLAWGVVPTQSAKLQSQTPASLLAKFNEGVAGLAQAAKVDRALVVRQAMITPSCGAGSLPVADSERAFDLLSRISRGLREQLDAAA